MNEERQAVEWMRRLASAAPDVSEMIDADENYVKLLEGQVAELRKLVQIAWDKGQWSNENWEDWSAQHPILQHNS